MFEDIRESILPVLDTLFSDSALSRTVTYKRFDGETFDANLKHTVASYVSSSVQAIRMQHTARSAANAPGPVQAGQVMYMIRASQFPKEASLKDLIVDGNETVSVAGINNIFGIVVEVTVESGWVNS